MPEADAALVADNLTKTFSTGRTGLGRTKVSAVDGVTGLLAGTGFVRASPVSPR